MAEAEAQGEGPEENHGPSPVELTVKGLIVGVVLALLLGAANMYVGMRVGLTVSASIPAAVLSMGVLRFFKERTIQENNIAQTVASAAEALAAGVIFTVPALLLLGIWQEVDILDTFLIAIVGGLLGVLFAVPLRKALIVDKGLPFPEGVAAAAVLEAGHGGRGSRLLVAGAITGGIFAFLQLGLGVFPTTAEWATRAGDTLLFLGTDLSLILIGVGFLVGLRISSLIFAGGAFAWFIVLPLLSSFSGVNFLDVPPTGGLNAVDAAFAIWDSKIRLLGAGAMFTGGVLAVWNLRDSLGTAAREGLDSYRGVGREDTDGLGVGDLPMKLVLLGLAILILPLAFLNIGALEVPWQGLTTTALVVVAGFLLSAVAGYMAGVVGSSNNPVSGVTILALAATSGLLLLFGVQGEAGILGALFVAAFIAVAAAISGDTMQDLKTGHMVKATPWKQQMAQMLGIAVFALIAPFVLGLLDDAFTIGSKVMPAPQAGLMASLLEGFFGQGVDLLMLSGGALIGAVTAAAGFSVLPVAVGVYLPLGLSAPIFAGGLLRYGVQRYAEKAGADETASEQRGTLLASGVIAGEAVAGILLAGLIVQDASTGTTLTVDLAPLILGFLAGGGVLLVLGRGRWPMALALGWALAGTLITVLMMLEVTWAATLPAAAVAAPLLVGLLVGLGVPVAGGASLPNWLAGLAFALLGVGLAVLLAGGTLVTSLAGGPLVGLLIMAYGAGVITYLALRPQVLPEDT